MSAVEGAASLARARYERYRRFLSHDVWMARLEDLPARRALGYRAARIAYCTVRALIFEDTLHLRAAALTYFTVLSLVPMLAFAFALLKGFGAYDALVQDAVRPYVMGLLAGNEPLRQAFEKTLGFVGDTGVASLGALGLLFLLYTATRLLRNIEGALNHVWGAATARSPFEQLRDYVAILVVTPLCLMAAVTLTTFGQALDLLRAAGETLGIGSLLNGFISVVGPLTVLFLGLLFLYTVLPTASVRLRSATLGAMIGAVLWYIVLIAHVRFQVGVARFNALYSSFAAFPIFLAWQHVSWLVVLIGAQIAALHQRHRSMAQSLRLASADQALREAICLSAALDVTRAFIGGRKPPRLEQLSARLGAPDALISGLLDRLIDAEILLKTADPGGGAYALARAPDLVRAKDVLDALRRSPASPRVGDEASSLDRMAVQTWRDLDRAVDQSPANRSLSDLARSETSQDGAAQGDDAAGEAPAPAAERARAIRRSNPPPSRNRRV
jgi:membrane protein